MSTQPGGSIGPYVIQRELGRGGMGVVYLATDERLGRQVAIKALPPALASDPARLERFEREARTLATLSHTNLAGIYGVEEQGGARYLILEYVEGETLEDRLDRGPLPIDDALELAVQIAAGVEAAHEAGVIHRDLKPANIIITPDGVAKVLDFGLARSDGGGSSSASPDAETVTTPSPRSPTVEGAILGTAAYMSPEQARGRRVDKRSDIWSFGIVLYEMLVGQSPFRGETAGDSIGAVLHKNLDLDSLPPGTPSNVRRVLGRCLERDRNERWRDIGDARIDLMHGDDAPRVESAGAGRTRGLGAATIIGLMITVAGLAATAAWIGSRATLPGPERVVRKLEILAAGLDESFNSSSPQISPDGMKIAFIQGDVMRVRDLATFDVQTIVEANGLRRLTWSPDGRWLAYATSSGLFRVPVTGGGASRIGDLTTGFQFAWTDNDEILFAHDPTREHPSIFAVPARGGTPATHLEASHDEVMDFHAVSVIPGSDVVLYVRHLVDNRTPIEAWDGERSVVIADFDDLYLSVPVWSPSGQVLFARGFGELSIWAVPFSPERMEVTGDPFLVETDASAPSVSANGALSFVRGSAGFSGELIWILPDGSVETIGDGGELVAMPIVSPDGSRLVFMAGSTPNDLEIWVRDLERGINSRISSLGGLVYPVAWSPDGAEIAAMNFNPTDRERRQQTVFLAADGSGPTREPYPGLLAAFGPGWKHAALITDPQRGSAQISAIDLTERTVIGEIATVSSRFVSLSLSPDGEYLLYESNESGKLQVFCTRFPGGEGRWQVSSDGASGSHWSPDGAAVYYMNMDQELMRVEVTREPSLRFGIPQPVFPAKPDIGDFAAISPAPDGERFVSVRGRDDKAAAAGYKLLLIENWYEEFRERERR